MHCNQSPLISIIIPVYNVEKYLDKCIASVVNQTYQNLEIILVDDGSPDNCPALCDQWQSRDQRIKVIHQENGGLSHARNEGLKLATGEFIGLVDSDDWIEPQMVETLLDVLLETEADIAACNFRLETEASKDIQTTVESSERKCYTSEEALRSIFTGGSIHIYVWNKLYRRSVLSNITFPEGKIYEDNLWTVQVVGNARLLVCVDCPLYHYLYRPESLSHDNRQLARRIRDKIEMAEQRIKYLHQNYPKLERFAILSLQTYCWQEYLDISLNCQQIDADGEIRRYIHHSFKKWSCPPNLILGKYKLGLICFIFRFYPRLLSLIYFIYKNMNNLAKR